MSDPHERRILLVEDDEMHAELIKRSFEDRPAIILTVAHRIDEAVDALKARMPDMVIADLRLPDGRGIELCEGAKFPIVIMTSQGSEADAVEAMRAGALDYIVKSDVMFSDMPHVVERALREWTLAKAHARADQQLHTQYEIASALATSNTLEQAGSAILESICRAAGWPVGELWRVDDQAGLLRREALCALEPEFLPIVTTASDTTFAKGEGFPGAAWAKNEPLSSPLPLHDSSVQSRESLTDHGLRCAYGFPVHTSEGRAFALLTFYARELDPAKDDIHRLLGTVSAHLNIFAERQRAEEDRRRLQQELLERERLAAVGETAATLAHEIGNPLNVMYMQAQLLQRQLSRMPNVDPKLAKRVEMLLAENIRLAQLLQDFRSLARRDELRLIPTDIPELLEHLLDMKQPLLAKASIETVREIQPDLPAVVADEPKLRQVFINLMKNAIEAMPEGGQLTVRAALDGERLVIDIIDTGSGLPEDIDVFEPFRTTKATGTGLGLPIARRVLAAHGGTISCSSTPGSGTTFQVVLPVRAPTET